MDLTVSLKGDFFDLLTDIPDKLAVHRDLGLRDEHVDLPQINDMGLPFLLDRYLFYPGHGWLLSLFLGV